MPCFFTPKGLHTIAQGCRVLAATLGRDASIMTPSPLYSGERVGVRGSGCFAAIRPLTPDPSPPETQLKKSAAVRDGAGQKVH